MSLMKNLMTVKDFITLIHLMSTPLGFLTLMFLTMIIILMILRTSLSGTWILTMQLSLGSVDRWSLLAASIMHVMLVHPLEQLQEISIERALAFSVLCKLFLFGALRPGAFWTPKFPYCGVDLQDTSPWLCIYVLSS
ncbi:uncharacterized protein LOC113754770 [Coffea eugenioides]|uniref:uncharacterized protein LOC113754770 n=1 Tax=Coffea eugenioides TaxID=49369 RepID=UPI000F60BFDC|nr:uncharacterized protein LOC113754770 [Coffea eugenioides]